MQTAQVTLPALFAELVVIAPLVTATIAIIAFIFNARLQKRAKVVDVISDCHKRYETLIYEIRAKIGREITLDSYIRRFWELQNEQFVLWRFGFIPNHIFRYWLSRREKEHNLPLVPGETMTAEQSWGKIKDELQNPPFVRLMDQLITKGHKSAYGTARRNRFFRRLGSAIGVIAVVLASVVAILMVGFITWPTIREYLATIM
jgi:hypothetical protein